MSHTKGLQSRIGLVTIIFIATSLMGCDRETPHPLEACLVGAYQMMDRIAIVSPATGKSLRLRFVDGFAANLVPTGERSFDVVPGLSPGQSPSGKLVATTDDCATAELHDPAKPAETFRKLRLQEISVNFQSAGLQLHGKFVLPPTPGPHDYVVLVHGSEADAATRHAYHQYVYAAQDVAVFVYDKRGTGSSSGSFSSNFEVLANDVVAALNFVRTDAPSEIRRLGLSGFSQGGWVAPLAALIDGAVDFVQVSYGLVDSPLAEDREEAFRDIRLAGFGEDAVEAASPLIAAMHAAIASEFESNLDELSLLWAETANESWRKHMQGEFVGDLLRLPVWLLPIAGPIVLDTDLIWDYDSKPVLEALDMPLLWIVAGADWEAPPEQTLNYLHRIEQRNSNLTVVAFPNTDHGMVRFTEADGIRTYTVYEPTYFSLLTQWISELDKVSSTTKQQKKAI